MNALNGSSDPARDRIGAVCMAALVILLAASPGRADTLNVPGQYASIQSAINAALPGDEILVGPGIYSERIFLYGKAITVRTAAGPAATWLVADSFLDGHGVVNFTQSEGPDTVFEGFTIIPMNTFPLYPGIGVRCAGSSPTIRKCMFRPDGTPSSGYFKYIGLSNENGSSPAVVGCLFTGGEIIDFFFRVTQVAIANQSSNPLIVNCTVLNNIGGTHEGGMYSSNWSRPTVVNSIFRGNVPAQITDESYSVTGIQYSNIQGGWPGPGNLNADPRFVNPNAGDYRLGTWSRCVDAGNTVIVNGMATTDLDGHPRMHDDAGIQDWGLASGGPCVDMGAYERTAQSPTTILIPYNLPRIQNALDVTVDGATVFVGPGVFNEALDFRGRSVRLASLSGSSYTILSGINLDAPVIRIRDTGSRVARVEGFTLIGADNTDEGEGGGLQIEFSAASIKDCILYANNADLGGGAYVLAANPVFENCQFSANTAGTGAGLHVQTGNVTVKSCTFSGNVAEQEGGAIKNINFSNLQVLDSTFTGNLAASAGAILSTDYSRMTVRNSNFLDNEADYGGAMMVRSASDLVMADSVFASNRGGDGGAVHIIGGRQDIVRCDFRDNFAALGSAMYVATSDTYIASSRFFGNYAGVSGGLYFYNSAKPVVVNCLFSGNSAASYGGAIFSFNNADAAIHSSTFSGNTALEGGAVYVFDELSDTVITNCLLWGNVDAYGEGEIAGIGSMDVTFTDVQGGYPGIGNGNEDPGFIDPDGLDDIFGTLDDDLRIRPASGCVDAGDVVSLPADRADLDQDGDVVEPMPFDLDGDPRVEMASVDMGALETPACPSDSDRDGQVNVVDLLALFGDWGCTGICDADVNYDGTVNVVDLLQVLAIWGECP